MDQSPRTPEAADEFRLGDSPWFWLALFGTIAICALLLVQQKYAKRQLRLELRYQNRVSTQKRNQAGAQAQAGPEVTSTAIAERPPEPHAALGPLVLVLAVATLIGFCGLLIAWRKHRALLMQNGMHAP